MRAGTIPPLRGARSAGRATSAPHLRCAPMGTSRHLDKRSRIFDRRIRVAHAEKELLALAVLAELYAHHRHAIGVFVSKRQSKAATLALPDWRPKLQLYFLDRMTERGRSQTRRRRAWNHRRSHGTARTVGLMATLACVPRARW
ncbi:protein of unknown function [Burkholderia multivorans]